MSEELLRGFVIAAFTVVFIGITAASCVAYQAKQQKEIMTACLEKVEKPIECAWFDTSRGR